jgi:hypothetical protein
MPQKNLLICISILVASISQAQKKITFTPQYQPQSMYEQKMEQSSTTEIGYGGDNEQLKEIMAKNGPKPMKTESTINSIIKTGVLAENTWFPVTLEITASNSSGVIPALPVGTVLYGKCLKNELPFFDSIYSEKMDAVFKQNVLRTIQASQQQFSSGEKKLSIGDTIVQDSKLNMPMAGATVEMNITTIYTLRDISKGIATLDVAQVFSMDSFPGFSTPMATGSGSGKMLYNTEEKFLLNYSNEAFVEMKMATTGVELVLKVSNGMVQTTTILKK